MKSVIRFAFALVLFSGLAAADTISSISVGFNGTAIKGGDYIWFSAVFKPSTTLGSTATGPVTLYEKKGSITFTANSQTYTIPVPDATITFASTNSLATVTYGANGWTEKLPTSSLLSGNEFLDGVAFQIPAAGLPAGIKPVTWTASFSTSDPMFSVNWQMAAAVYTSGCVANYATSGVKPVDSTSMSSYKNSDHAGTPETCVHPLTKSATNIVIGGATGGGGSNYTGSYSGTFKFTPNTPTPPPPPKVPEPGTLVLFGTGLMGTAAAVRRKLQR